MQRRAAAIYAAIFIVIAAGAYAMVGVATEPTISIENPEHSLSSGDEFSVNDRDFTVSSLSDGSAEFVWTEENARFTETWQNGSTVTLAGTDFEVMIDNTTPPAVNLLEVRELGENVSTVEQDGTTYVIQEEDGQQVLVPRDEYLAEEFGIPETRRYTEGDRFTFENQTVRVASIETESVTLSWTGEKEHTVSVDDGANVTLNGKTFVAHFPDANTVELESNYRSYASDANVIETYHERINGLWAVSLLSSLAAIGIIGLAYLPSRY